MNHLYVCVVIVAVTLGTATSDTGQFWHVTDQHFDFSFFDEGVSCHENLTLEQRGFIGHGLCDSSWRLVNSSNYAMKQIAPDVDFVIWTGDFLLHTTDDRHSLSTGLHLHVFDTLTNKLKEVFPDVITYPALGAHDYFPEAQYPDHDNAIYRGLEAKFRDWISGADFHHTFRKGGYYCTEIRPGLRLISLNTNLYYVRNQEISNFTDVLDPAGQFQWLNHTLANVTQNQEKVMIIAHIAPGLKGYEGYLWMYEPYNRRLMDIIREHADSGIIVGMHFGHDHDDEFKIIYNDRDEPKVPVFIAPSVTPWRFKDSEGKLGRAHNPGIRLVTYDRETGRHIDIQQYYLDLEKSNDERHDEWQLLYTATDVYGIRDVTATSLAKARELLRKKSSHIQDYYKRITLMADDSYCDTTCRFSIYCGMKYFNVKKFETCKSKLLSSESVSSCVRWTLNAPFMLLLNLILAHLLN